MALSTCIKCGGLTTFEIVENTPLNSAFKLMFVQCARCGGVVGAMDYYNIGEQTADIKAIVNRIASRVGA